MHKLLEIIITKPKLAKSWANHEKATVRRLARISRLDPESLFGTIVNSYLYYNSGLRIGDGELLPADLVVGFSSLDALYREVVELYKEAVGVVPSSMRDVIVSGKVVIKYPELPEGFKPLIVLRGPMIHDGKLEINLCDEVNLTILSV